MLRTSTSSSGSHEARAMEAKAAEESEIVALSFSSARTKMTEK